MYSNLPGDALCEACYEQEDDPDDCWQTAPLILEEAGRCLQVSDEASLDPPEGIFALRVAAAMTASIWEPHEPEHPRWAKAEHEFWICLWEMTGLDHYGPDSRRLWPWLLPIYQAWACGDWGGFQARIAATKQALPLLVKATWPRFWGLGVVGTG